jgi:hypothetical protein
MGLVVLQLEDGRELHLEQMLRLQELSEELDEESGPNSTHWHFNTCGCCVSLHGSDCSYVISQDGEATFFPGRGCGCT